MIKFSGTIENVIEKYIGSEIAEDSYKPENNIVQEINAFQRGHNIVLSLKYKSDKPIKQPNFGFIVYDHYDNALFGTNPLKAGVSDFSDPKCEGIVEVEISSPFLVNGTYPVSVWFSEGIAMGEHFFKKEKCINLHLSHMDGLYVDKIPTIEGLTIPMCEWSFK
jgi:lipopolysaccharide transport system ATP-binding protein